MAKRKTSKDKTLRAVLLAELKAADKPVFRISQEAGVSHPVLYHFLDGRRTELRATTIEKLLAYFDLEVRRK